MNAVQVNNLVRTFGKFKAVNDISFSVVSGEVFGFLGANGAGKSTTIRMLCGILPPSSGELKVMNIDVSEDSHEVKKRVGYMSQKFSLYPDLSVEENIKFFGGIHGLPPEKLNQRMADVVESAELQGAEKKLTAELSAGEKQKLALGCAMLHEPRIIFLDEPTAGVDPSARRMFWENILRLKKDGITVFVTSHYMDEVEQCDRIALMHAGKIVALDSPDALKKNIIPGFVIYFESSNFRQAKEFLLDSGHYLRVDAMGSGGHAITQNKKGGERAAISRLHKTLTASGLEVGEVETHSPSLEDVFVYLIGSLEAAQ